MVERMGQNILAISRSRVASALITYGLCVVFFWLTVLCFSGQAQAATMSCKVQGHWRDVAYNEMPMKQYASLKNCIAWTAYQFNLPEELLYSIIYVERGPLNGKCGTNRNGTQDCGPGQINDVRLSELKQFGLSKRDIRKKPCHNIWAMGYLIRREIEKAGGNIGQVWVIITTIIRLTKKSMLAISIAFATHGKTLLPLRTITASKI